MAEKKQESFTVTDRRLFTPEGEMREEISQEEVSSAPPTSPPAPPQAPVAPVEVASPAPQADTPPAPTAAEQKEQADAYSRSAKDLDARVELSGHSSKELEMTFERFMASLYMSAMLQLGLRKTSYKTACTNFGWLTLK
jgi:hypothetical protein